MKRWFGTWVAFALCIAPPSWAQGSSAAPPSDPASLITVAAELAGPIASGGEGVLRVRVTIAPGWHANANPPSLDYLIPTAVSIDASDGLSAVAPRYPNGELLRFAFADEPLSVYEGTITIEVPLRAGAGVSGARTLRGEVRFQACNDELCLAPAAKPFTATVTIGDATEAPVLRTTESALAEGAAAESATATPSDAPPSAGSMRVYEGASTSATHSIQRLFDEHGLLAFFTVFALGLGLNLTPCVYPMLSVTLALFGARTEKRLWARVPPAFTYMLGIAVTYSVLGLVAAFTGTLFGAALQSPLVQIGIAAILAAMALSMFGLFELQLPSGLLTRLTLNTGGGLAGVFLSGVMVGIFAAPCIGPPIVALLAVVAQNGNPWFGFTTFFVLSLGLGLPYLILGVYTGLLQRLPRSGDWMVWVKKIFGVLLLAVALFYLSLVVKPEWALWVVPAALILGGAYLGFFEPWREGRQRRRELAGAGISPNPIRVSRFAWFQRGLGVVAIAAGIWIVATTPRGGLEFSPFSVERLEQARAEGRPVILDFYADWCVPCHELDRITFTHPDVLRHAGRFVTLKVDLTRSDSEAVAALQKRFRVEGVPTVIFLAPDGTEVPETRVVGFVPGPEFAALARRALQTVQPASAGG